jgi:hypothetical protein
VEKGWKPDKLSLSVSCFQQWLLWITYNSLTTQCMQAYFFTLLVAQTVGRLPLAWETKVYNRRFRKRPACGSCLKTSPLIAIPPTPRPPSGPLLVASWLKFLYCSHPLCISHVPTITADRMLNGSTLYSLGYWQCCGINKKLRYVKSVGINPSHCSTTRRFGTVNLKDLIGHNPAPLPPSSHRYKQAS